MDGLVLANPDLFLDLIKPSEGGINLYADQRKFLRSATRFQSMYGVFSRGYGKTFDEVIVQVVLCIRYPNMMFALTAQTKEGAAELLKDKWNEIILFYPWIENEVVKTKFSKNDAEILFKNGSRMDVLANSQTSKGQRRKRIYIEEAALLNDELFQDALAPIVEVGRQTYGKLAIVDPLELNQQISFFTTSGYNGSTEYIRTVNMIKSMAMLEGDIVCGAGWQLPCYYGRGSSKDKIIKIKKASTPIFFDQNYNSVWAGNGDSAIINITKLLKSRVLEEAVLESDDREVYIGVDVARSENTSNNQTSIVVLEVIRNKSMRIKHIDVINLINISNALNFTQQAIEIKRIKKQYHAKFCALDRNGLGVGLCDELRKEHKDPISGETYKCWKAINSDAMPDKNDYEECLYEIVATSNNNEIIVNFMNMFESGKLRLLVRKQNSDYSIDDNENIEKQKIPFIQTDLLVDEITNLKVKYLNNGKLSVEKVVKRMNKDRFSALAYGLYYINAFEDFEQNESDNFEEMLKYTLFL